MKKGIDCSFVSPKGLVSILNLLFITIFSFGQDLTDISVYPTRVTEGITVTIEYTGPGAGYFNNSTRNSIRFLNGGMDARNKILVSPKIMTFDIGRDDTTTNPDPSFSDPVNIDIIRELQFNGPSGSLSNTGIDVQYIAPTAMIHAVNDLEGRLQVNPRVEEIYTDYGGVKTYKDGDEFTRGRDINSTTYGRWEFFGLTFPATPSGVLLETGGEGRGMFIGFNSSGDFIVRGGDGRPGASGAPNPAGCARDVIPASTFAGKSGRLLVTLEPREGLPTSGQLTVLWDEDDDDVADYTSTITAVSGYLGYNSFREWSGGNQGFVGRSNGNIAGAEVSGTADFNGTIGSMTFSNSESVPIAWRSSQGTYSGQPSNERPANPIIPDNYHDLLGFKLDGVIYSTGANDPLLELFLGDEVDNDDGSGGFALEYVPQTFKAYSTNGVQNTTVRQHHIFTGEFVDGKEIEGTTEFRSGPNDPDNLDPDDPDYEVAFENIKGLSMFDVLIDGKNGLNIGSGINNLNQSTSIQFFSGNGQFGAVTDGIPDLLIPNMAEAGGTDVYYYTDILGNVIGRPISIRINNSDSNNPPLSHWQNDQYRVDHPGFSFDDAKPTERIYGEKQERPMRLIAFSLEDFGITENAAADNFWKLQSIYNINAGAGGTADIPFLAYNGASFAIRSPLITDRPTPRSICNVPSNIDVEFTVQATVDGGFSTPADPLETLQYQWFRYNTPVGTESTNPDLQITNVDKSELGLYRLRVRNGYGTTIVTVDLTEGGTPARWNGSEWIYPTGFVSESDPSPGLFDIPVADEDRKLIFSENFNVSSDDLEGCDCVVPADRLVTVSNGHALKLYGEVTLSPEEPIFDNDGIEIGTLPAGQLIVEDNSSLLQAEDIDVNDNIGEAEIRRNADNLALNDYIYWSSPVRDFELTSSNLPNDRSFYWKVDQMNGNGTDGNWISHSGIMDSARGYIARVPANLVSSGFTTFFKGVPNNGLIKIDVLKSTGSQPLGRKHWNLLGNPYPSALSALKFLSLPANDRLEGAVYIWTRGGTYLPSNPNPYYQTFSSNYSDQYVSHNGTGSVPANSFDGNIASGQGFFVKVRDASAEGEVEFRNTMRYGVNNLDDLDNSEFYRTNQNLDQEKQRIWLNIVNNQGNSVSALIGYVAGATLGKDRLYDAYSNQGSFALYSVLDEERMAIQGRPLPFNENDYVALGARIPQTGIYNIAIDHLDGSIILNDETSIVLEDTYKGVFHNLKEAPYAFDAQRGTYNDRFILRYNAQLLSTKDLEIPDTFAYIKDNRLHIQSKELIEGVQVFDMSGKLVLNFEAKGNQFEIETNFNRSRGAYIALIELAGGITVSKKLIN